MTTDVAEGLRVVVADDEPVAAALLAADLTRLGCTVLAVTRSGDEALAACAELRPDACFTDVSMPGTDGLAVARTLRSMASGMRVVFVSAHPHFAIDAYSADVIDFVVKPFHRSRLAEAVDRVQRSRIEPDGGGRLLVPERGSIHVVPIRDIEWVQADAYNLWLHTPARAWMLRERMHRLQPRLEAVGFVRVHRSAMVRRTAIVSLDTTYATEPYLVLRSGARVRVARDRLQAIRKALD